MDLRFTRALLTISLRASVALRGAFLLQVALMALNNLFFFSTWWLLFQRFDHIRGWRMPDMLALYGVSATGFGLCAVTCGGMFELARTIAEGELDALLSQPRDVLLRAIASRSRASGWGDVLSGLGLIALSGYWHLQTTPAVLLSIVLAGAAYTACGVLLHSTAFWLGHVEGLARQLFEFVIAFSLYPPSLFGAGIRVVLFTLIPAGLVSYLPVELVRDFHWSGALLASSAVLAYALLAARLFARGLRRYESGSRFG